VRLRVARLDAPQRDPGSVAGGQESDRGFPRPFDWAVPAISGEFDMAATLDLSKGTFESVGIAEVLPFQRV
jgi:hypothetical protein